jgi:hypothetical protein
MILFRKIVALLSLSALGGLIVTLERGFYGVNPRFVLVAYLLLVPLGLSMIGLVMERLWSRWLALAGAVAVLPWAFVLTFGMPRGVPLIQQSIALVASVLLLLSLSGRAMFERYEGQGKKGQGKMGQGKMDWSGPRMRLVRWTIILNIASAIGLLLFVAVYRYSVEWHVAIPAVLLMGIVVGVLLLAQQKTFGLLLVALSCVLFVPAGTFFVWKEASYSGEVYLFAAVFLPGVVAGWACLFSFGKPIWQALRSG